MVPGRIKLSTANYQLPTAQSGQSLIETILAIFILTTTLTAGLGLTIYAFSSSTTSQNEIVASNLAREGVEAVRMMRDSNWLAGDVKGGAWDLQACADIGSRLCYPNAYLGVTGYNSYVLNAGNQRASFNSGTSAWLLDNTAAYDLYLQAGGSYTPTTNAAIPVFARMINISFNTAAPYTAQNSNEEMIVKSVVAWRGKNCTSFATNQDLLALSTPCKVVVEEHMTNWKDYK